MSASPETETPSPTPGRSHFIRDIVEEDNRTGKWGGRVVTRFPPEPNGYLHIGHAKSICLNFGLAQEYGGTYILRFDDTNPVTEDERFVHAIERDIRWLGFDWGETRFASDYFEWMYERAVRLVQRGKAYVDDQSQEDISTGRGTVTEPGTPSPFRDRAVEENLDLLARMRAGEFPDGSRVLRAKIDMAHPNMLMRDPLLYRIRHAHHHRQGGAWCIYPMYDFAHCLEDSYEGITHSLCTLEFENNRPLYDWVLEESEAECRPQQIEFAKLLIEYVVLGKRKLIRLVNEGHVDGWDDPRLPTLAGLRRRGVTPEAIRSLCEMVGVSKANSLVDFGKLEYCIRDDLNHRAPRVMCVLRPLRVTLTNFPEGTVETLDAPHWPVDVPREGTRAVPLSRDLLVDAEDFVEDPPPGWHRLAPGREVRLRYGYMIRCDEVVRDEAGAVVELRCTYDPATRHGAPAGRRVKGTVHWVSAPHALPCEVRLYDRLFTIPEPGADPDRDFILDLNPESLVVCADARIEPSVADDPAGSHHQFERLGYFVSDIVDSRPGRLVFNRTVTLRDSWAKATAPIEEPARRAPRRSAAPSPPQDRETDRDRARAADPALAARYARYTADLGVDAADADVLTGDPRPGEIFEGALAVCDDAPLVAKWVVNEALPALDGSPAYTPAQFGELVALVAAGTLSASAAKDVLAEMARSGDDPAEVVAALGLRQVSDAQALAPLVDDVLAGDPDAVARYRAGKVQLLGHFVGLAMRASGGKANPALLRGILLARLDPKGDPSA